MNLDYYDTGLTLKLLVEEPLSKRVQSFVQAQRKPLPFTWLIELETLNALHAKLYRKEISAGQLEACLGLLAKLRETGRLRLQALESGDVIREMTRLVSSIGGKTGCRTLDLMHVASALLLGSPRFISSDKRQLLAAKAAGLKTVNIEEHAGSSK